MRHRVMLLNPRYGKPGMLAFPYFFFLEMLGPVIEALGYVSFAVVVVSGRANYPYVLAFLMVAILLGVALSVAAVALEELSFRRYPGVADLVRLFYLAVLENFGYRQLSAWWRVRGTISAMRGVEGWGQMQRKGFTFGEDEEESA
jgi:hypothetical protein